MGPASASTRWPPRWNGAACAACARRPHDAGLKPTATTATPARPMGQPERTTDLPHTPFLALDMDVFDRNVARLADTIITRGGKRWRPHVKAIRSPTLALLLQAAGACGVTCANVREARAMVTAGITDVLIASQVVQPADLEIVAHLNRHATVTVAVDVASSAALVSAAARAAGTRIPVVVEVEVGLQRAGAPAGAEAIALAQLVHADSCMTFSGFMAWEGHTTRIADPAAKREAIHDAVALLTSTASEAAAAGLPVDIVSCGGTGTFETTALVDGVTEVQAGGGVFGDLQYREDFRVPLERALTLCSTVVARPTPTRIVCDAGFKSLAVYPKAPRVIGIGDVTGLSHSAENLTIRVQHPAERPCVGDRILLEVGYADASTFLHRQIVGLRAGRVQSLHDLIAVR
ncbi:MAG: DSD1 family PLP-dependent enzyme [Haliea sp.]|nr:MAG: DSD1 family PLP-dependent enzyme [Haliea sp.]